jgi:hypothetical protein
VRSSQKSLRLACSYPRFNGVAILDPRECEVNQSEAVASSAIESRREDLNPLPSCDIQILVSWNRTNESGNSMIMTGFLPSLAMI